MSDLALAADQRKRLGQYFTGVPLARVLAALANSSTARTIVDPMSGSGDMLIGCLEVGAQPEQMMAIEIEPVAARVCDERLSSAGTPHIVVTGSAFDDRSWNGAPNAWDLVITNPPYVRYQTASTGLDSPFTVPSAEDVRTSLLECLSSARNLGDSERAAFLECAKEYSGLADLAVPSWVLCASLVRRGGRLAMVVPDTWLSRNYAVPVLYLLRRFFEIEFVVRDANASWFADALVRTNLVIARRVLDKGSALGHGGHLQIVLPSTAAEKRSLVGRAFVGSEFPEVEFARWARASFEVRGDNFGPVEATWSEELDLIRSLRRGSGRHNLILNDLDFELGGASTAPEGLGRILGVTPANLVSLQHLGWAVGQGLRTGANDFFYLARDPCGGVRSALLEDVLHLPEGVSRAAVKRQADLPARDRRVVLQPISEVLMLDNWALPEDIKKAHGPKPWRCMKGDLAQLVRSAAATSYERHEKTIALSDLSAVRTNIRSFNPSRPERPARFWYQLPPLAERHTPSLYMPRVNNGHPTAYLNPGRSLVVDANFSTFWPTGRNCISAKAILALLSSTWVRCFLELSGTVLGGGALKVEATHLRHLLIPKPTDSIIRRLDQLAIRLLTDEPDGVLTEIDEAILESMHPRPAASAREAIRVLAAQLLRKRTL